MAESDPAQAQAPLVPDSSPAADADSEAGLSPLEYFTPPAPTSEPSIALPCRSPIEKPKVNGNINSDPSTARTGIPHQFNSPKLDPLNGGRNKAQAPAPLVLSSSSTEYYTAASHEASSKTSPIQKARNEASGFDDTEKDAETILKALSAEETTEPHSPPNPLDSKTYEMSKKEPIRSSVSRSQSLRIFPPSSFIESMEDRLLRYRPSASSGNHELALNGHHPLQAERLPIHPVLKSNEGGKIIQIVQPTSDIHSEHAFTSEASECTMSDSLESFEAKPLTRTRANNNDPKHAEPSTAAMLDRSSSQPPTLDTAELLRELNRIHREGKDVPSTTPEEAKHLGTAWRCSPLFHSSVNAVPSGCESGTLVALRDPNASPMESTLQRSPLQCSTSTQIATPLHYDENGQVTNFRKQQSRDGLADANFARNQEGNCCTRSWNYLLSSLSCSD